MEVWNLAPPDCSATVQLAPGQYSNPAIVSNLSTLFITSCLECPPFHYQQATVDIILCSSSPFVTVSRSVSISGLKVTGCEAKVHNSSVFDVRAGSSLDLWSVTVESFSTYVSVVSASSQAIITMQNSSFVDVNFLDPVPLPLIDQAVSVLFIGASSILNIRSSSFFGTHRKGLNGIESGVVMHVEGCLDLADSLVSGTRVNLTEHPDRFTVPGAIFLHPSCPSSTITRSIFQDNVLTLTMLSIGGALTYSPADSAEEMVLILDSRFLDNTARLGGAVGILSDDEEGATIAFYNCSFERNMCSHSGGAVASLVKYLQLEFQDCSFDSNKIVTDPLFIKTLGGAALMVTAEPPFGTERSAGPRSNIYSPLHHFNHRVISRPPAWAYLTIQNCKFAGSSFSGDVGTDSLLITAQSIYTVSMHNITVRDHPMPRPEPLIRVDKMETLYVTNSTFINNYAPSIHASNIQGGLEIEAASVSSCQPASLPLRPSWSYSCVFEGNTFHQDNKSIVGNDVWISSATSTLLRDNLVVSTLANSLGMPYVAASALNAVIFIESPQSAALIDNITIDFYPRKRIGLSASSLAILEESNSLFRNPTSASLVSSILIQSCQFSVSSGPASYLYNSKFACYNDTRFEGNRASFEGSAIKLSGTPAEILSSTFSENWAKFRGTVLSDSTISISKSLFQHNKAGSNGGALWTGFPAQIFDSTFQDNSALTGGAIAAYADVQIFNTYFSSNYARNQGGAIWVGPSTTANIVSSTFDSNRGSDLGGAIYADMNSTLSLSDSSFTLNYVWVARSFPGANDPDFIVDAESFAYSAVTQGSGAAISAVLVHTLQVFGCSFLRSDASMGSDIYMQRLPSILEIKNSSFLHPERGYAGSIALQPPLPNTVDDPTHKRRHASPVEAEQLRSSRIQRLLRDLVASQDEKLPYGLCESSEGSLRYINNCTFAGNENGPFLFWIPCSNASVWNVPTVEISKTKFSTGFSLYGGAAYLVGPPQPFLNWTDSSFVNLSSTHGGSAFFYNLMHNPSTLPTSPQNIQQPCTTQMGCTYNLNRGDADLAMSTGYSLMIATSTSSNSSGESMAADTTAPTSLHHNGPNTVPATSKPYLWSIASQSLRLGLVDLYGKTPQSPGTYNLEFSLVMLNTYDKASNFCSAYSSQDTFNFDINTSNPLKVSLNASGSLWRQPQLWKDASSEDNLLDRFHPAVFYYAVPYTSRNFKRFLVHNGSIDVLIGGCEPGEGLQPHPVLPNTFDCQPCPTNTYNLNGDGQCYLCNDPSLRYEQVTCSGSQVQAQQGFFVIRDNSDDLPSNSAQSQRPSHGRSNKLWVAECPSSYCGGFDGACQSSSFRHGILCRDCISLYSESLMFSACGSCPSHATSFLVVLIGFMVVASTVIHVGLRRNFGLTLFGTLMLITSLYYPKQWFSTLLAYELTTEMRDWACLASSSALTRATLFLPLATTMALVLGLIVVMAISIVFRGLVTLFQWMSGLSVLKLPSGGRVFASFIFSCWFVVGASAVPVVQTLIEYWACLPSPVGSLWMIAPSVSCSDPQFLDRRRLALETGIPYLVFCAGFVGYVSLRPFGVLQESILSSFETLQRGRIWIIAAFSLHALIGMLSSLSWWFPPLMTIYIPLVMLSWSCAFTNLHGLSSGLVGSWLSFVAFLACGLSVVPSLTSANHSHLMALKLSLTIVVFIVNGVAIGLSGTKLARRFRKCFV